MDIAVEEASPLAFIKQMFSCGLVETTLALCGGINFVFKNSDNFFSPPF